MTIRARMLPGVAMPWPAAPPMATATSNLSRACEVADGDGNVEPVESLRGHEVKANRWRGRREGMAREGARLLAVPTRAGLDPKER